jgi:hypothetical protein
MTSLRRAVVTVSMPHIALTEPTKTTGPAGCCVGEPPTGSTLIVSVAPSRRSDGGGESLDRSSHSKNSRSVTTTTSTGEPTRSPRGVGIACFIRRVFPWTNGNPVWNYEFDSGGCFSFLLAAALRAAAEEEAVLAVQRFLRLPAPPSQKFSALSPTPL